MERLCENAAVPVQKREAREAKHRDKLAKLVAEVCFSLQESALNTVLERRALVCIKYTVPCS